MNVSVYQNQSHNFHSLYDVDEDVFATSVIDRYAPRPLALQSTCLATFAVMYDVIQSSTKTGETQDVNTVEDTQKHRKSSYCHKDEITKRIGCHQEKGNSRQYYIQEGTKSIQNQKNTIMQNFSSVTHGMMKMT